MTLDGTALRLPAGIVLDLGATAKGLGSDRAVAAAGRACGQGGVLVSLGGDIAVAGLPPRGGWPVAAADSCDPGGGPLADTAGGPAGDPGGGPAGQIVRLAAGGLATSSVTCRQWQQGGQPVHHIIDPRTGFPAHGPWRTASVAAASCAEATPQLRRPSWQAPTRKHSWPGPGCRPGWWAITASCGSWAAGRVPAEASFPVRCPAGGPASVISSVIMTSAAAAAGSQGLWFVSRGSGLVLLVLLSAVMVLGAATQAGWAPRHSPRFVVAELHRTLSLFAVALLALHVLTAILYRYVTIGWAATVVPFLSPYRWLAIGLGAVAADLGAAVLLASILRSRLGFRSWRAVHWLAYLGWTAALMHALTAGNDMRTGWVAILVLGCAAIVMTAMLARLVITRSQPRAAGPLPGADHPGRLGIPLISSQDVPAPLRGDVSAAVQLCPGSRCGWKPGATAKIPGLGPGRSRPGAQGGQQKRADRRSPRAGTGRGSRRPRPAR